MIENILLGIHKKEFFNYNGVPFPIRPLSTYELDEAMIRAVEGISPIIFDKVVKLKLRLLEKDENIDLTRENYADFLRYYNEIDYWTVYYSTKDFQNEDFQKPDFSAEFEEEFEDWSLKKPKGYYIIRKMRYIHMIADDIMTMTDQPVSKLTEVLKNSRGRTLATMVHQFHVPLVSEAWKMTPLQTTFLYFSRPGAPEVVDDIEDIPGIKGGTLEEITKQLKAMGF